MDTNFIRKNKDFFTIEEVVKITGCEMPKGVDGQRKIENIKTLKDAGPGDASFLSNPKYINEFLKTRAGFCFMAPRFLDKLPEGMVPLVHRNPHYAYTMLLTAFYSVPIYDVRPGISDRAFVHPTAKIGEGVEIQPGAYLEENVEIGDGCKICANTFIGHNCKIGEKTFIGPNSSISYTIMGKNCIVKNGARIGQDGFGFVHNEMFNHKIPQIGSVKIGDFVEIGANTCIDRGAFDVTTIGNNTKIDNLIQIGHGVQIGMGCFLAGCTGIAGSTKIGNFVQVGGHSAIVGHIEIADGVKIAASSGIAQSIMKPMSSVGGSPARPILEWHRLNILLSKMVKKEV